MVQEPGLVRWTVEPVTVQLPVAANVTARAEDAVALTLKSGSPKFLLASAPNVIVWLPLAMENDCGTSAAALKLPSAACDAVIVHEPALVKWTVEPVTLQLPVAANVTASAEEAVALTLKSGSPKTLSTSALKV